MTLLGEAVRPDRLALGLLLGITLLFRADNVTDSLAEDGRVHCNRLVSLRVNIVLTLGQNADIVGDLGCCVEVVARDEAKVDHGIAGLVHHVLDGGTHRVFQADQSE